MICRSIPVYGQSASDARSRMSAAILNLQRDRGLRKEARMKREETIYCLKAQSERYSEVCEECPLYGQTGVDHCCEDALQMAIITLQNQPVWIPLPETYRESEVEYGK